MFVWCRTAATVAYEHVGAAVYELAGGLARKQEPQQRWQQQRLSEVQQCWGRGPSVLHHYPQVESLLVSGISFVLS